MSALIVRPAVYPLVETHLYTRQLIAEFGYRLEPYCVITLTTGIAIAPERFMFVSATQQFARTIDVEAECDYCIWFTNFATWIQLDAFEKHGIAL
jgi:hypothetical protein